jgi:hypothetical protein
MYVDAKPMEMTMRNMVPAVMVIVLALLLAGGAGADRIVQLALNHDEPAAEKSYHTQDEDRRALSFTL